MPAPRRHFASYKPPGKDSARAIANATLFLTSARSIDQVTADAMARQYRLKPATAERLLEAARARRVANALGN